MKKLILALALTMGVALVPVAVSADYTSPFGNTYTDAQYAAFCASLRPGSAMWVRYDCGSLP